MIKKLFLLTLSLLIFLTGCSSTPPKTAQTVAQTIPITMANLRGHQSLYNEGWFVITSSHKALAFAQKHAIDNAGQAWSEAVKAVKRDTRQYGKDMLANLPQGIDTGQSIFKKGTQNSQKILQTTHSLALKQMAYAQNNFVNAWESFIKGHVTYMQRTKEDWEALINLPEASFEKLKDDFSNLEAIASSITLLGGTKLAAVWEEAFKEAKESFLDAYKASGESHNTLEGLFYIMYGYLKALFHGVVTPTTETVAKTAYHGGTNIVKLATLPIGTLISVVGRSVESLGLTLYYVTSAGVKLVSPTVEAGFLSALSLLSLGSSGVTYVGGASAGLINQVGTTVAAPVVGAAHTAGSSAFDTAKAVTFISYELVKGGTKIFINEAASGVVLGYNALTALPTHLLLAASDSVFFLAWDGPRLVIASVKGEIASEDITKVPVGTVMDLKKLQTQEGVEVKVISKDYEVIEKVLHKVRHDMEVQ